MLNKKKFLLITSSYPNPHSKIHSGGGIFVEHFARELAKKENVILLTQQIIRGKTDTGWQSGIKIIRFRWRSNGKALSTLKLPQDFFLIVSVITKGFWACLKVGKTYKIDHTLAIWALPSGLWALCLKWIMGIPYSTWSLGSDIWNYKKNFFARNLLRLILHEAEKRYADGYQLKSDVETIAKKPCFFLATSRCLPKKTLIKADIKKGKKNYLFIGRYHANKGPDILLESIANLSQQSKQKVHFHLFGEGYLGAELKTYMEKNRLGDIVTLNDYIDADGAAAYLAACDALIIPSRIESIPVVLSDALKTGSKIIATDVGDMGYLLKKYRAGVVVPPGSAKKLAEVIENDLLQTMDPFAQGRMELLKLFDVAKTVEKFMSDHPSGIRAKDTVGGFEK